MVSPTSAPAVLPVVSATSPATSTARARGAGDQGVGAMQQQVSVITLGVADLARSRQLYANGFGWTPVFANDEIAFYQMNGFVLGTWLQGSLEADMRREGLSRPGAFALAHNVGSADEVQVVLDRLAAAGGRLPAFRRNVT